jgi:hypothetical protein
LQWSSTRNCRPQTTIHNRNPAKSGHDTGSSPGTTLLQGRKLLWREASSRTSHRWKPGIASHRRETTTGLIGDKLLHLTDLLDEFTLALDVLE